MDRIPNETLPDNDIIDDGLSNYELLEIKTIMKTATYTRTF